MPQTRKLFRLNGNPLFPALDAATDKADLGCFIAPKGLCPEGAEEFSSGFQPLVENLIVIHNYVGGKRSPSATIDCLEKHRSPVRTKYRLEAYATLLFGASSDSSSSCGKTITAATRRRKVVGLWVASRSFGSFTRSCVPPR